MLMLRTFCFLIRTKTVLKRGMEGFFSVGQKLHGTAFFGNWFYEAVWKSGQTFKLDGLIYHEIWRYSRHLRKNELVLICEVQKFQIWMIEWNLSINSCCEVGSGSNGCQGRWIQILQIIRAPHYHNCRSVAVRFAQHKYSSCVMVFGQTCKAPNYSSSLNTKTLPSSCWPAGNFLDSGNYMQINNLLYVVL